VIQGVHSARKENFPPNETESPSFFLFPFFVSFFFGALSFFYFFLSFFGQGGGDRRGGMRRRGGLVVTKAGIRARGMVCEQWNGGGN
jgi:hypothetical protein